MPRKKRQWKHNDPKPIVFQRSGALLFANLWITTYHASCPSTSLEAWSDSCSLTQWCHPTISSSVASLSSFPQSFLPSGSFSMSLYFRWQNIGALSTASVLQLNIQVWFPLGLIVLISLLPKGHSRVFSNKTIGKYKFFCAQPSFQLNTHICTWLLEKQEHWLYGYVSPNLCFCFLICCLVRS